MSSFVGHCQTASRSASSAAHGIRSSMPGSGRTQGRSESARWACAQLQANRRVGAQDHIVLTHCQCPSSVRTRDSTSSTVTVRTAAEDTRTCTTTFRTLFDMSPMGSSRASRTATTRTVMHPAAANFSAQQVAANTAANIINNQLPRQAR